VHPYTCPTTRAASPHTPESLLFPFTASELPPPAPHHHSSKAKQTLEAPQESELPFSTKKTYNNNNNNTNTPKKKKNKTKQKPDNIQQQQHCYLLQNIPNFQILKNATALVCINHHHHHHQHMPWCSSSDFGRWVVLSSWW
jgi:hypothetical protein